MHTEILKVTGMTCSGCVNEAQTSHEQLQSAIEKAGYGVEKVGLAAKSSAKAGCCG